MSEAIRVLHTADLHIGMENYGQIDPSTGLNRRVMDFLRRLDDVIAFALEKDVDLFLFAGDAYRNQTPNPTYQREFARRIKRLSDNGIPVLLLVGNHDLPGIARRANTLEIFKTLSVPGVIVGNKANLNRITTKRGDILVATVPYPVRSQLLSKEEYKGRPIREIDRLMTDKMAEVIGSLARQAVGREQDVPAILAGHFSVAGAIQGSEQNVMLGRDVIVLKSVVTDPTWDYVALGHIHRYQDLNEGAQPPVVYSGSLERVDFGEEHEEKGFVLAEVQRGFTRYRFRPGYKRQARPFVTIRADVRDALNPMESLLATIDNYDIRGAVVRLFVQMQPEQRDLLDESRVLAALKEAYTVVAINREFAHRAVRLPGGSAESSGPIEMLEFYFRQQGMPPEKQKKLLERARQLYASLQYRLNI